MKDIYVRKIYKATSLSLIIMLGMIGYLCWSIPYLWHSNKEALCIFLGLIVLDFLFTNSLMGYSKTITKEEYDEDRKK
jgi:hypothetical protein